jgi:23S rRNA (uracil1939-C5)-methyltransferase
LLQLLEASPDRVEPACAHYVVDRCGGCQLQHLSREAQRESLRRVVRDALQRVGHREIALPELVSGAGWGYRERLTLTLRKRGAAWMGGLHALDDAGRVFALDTCPIAHPRLIACWTLVSRLLRGLPLPGAGSELRLSLRLADGQGERVTLVIIGGMMWPDAADWAAQLHAAIPMVAAVWWTRDDGSSVALAGDAASDVLAFAQVNREVAAALQRDVLSTIRALHPTSVIDAYSGRGDFAEALAHDGARVTAIEADAMATARAATRLSAYPSTRVLTALVEDVLDTALPADVVILNPPRRGVDVRAISSLADAAVRGVRAIVYVSCDPATLARDLARLPRWRVESIRCYDMFPQTAHVETVCLLLPEPA